ncbi:MAG: hypothetical protein LBT14_08710 [Treponema sp.]|jgi:hypothetical protein|nr:hypothetical protein [Treponema sp.]
MMSIHLTQRVESLAKVEGRSKANQTAYLIEKEFQVLEQRLIVTKKVMRGTHSMLEV